jgi:type II secretory pathway pseudopilin PulG
MLRRKPTAFTLVELLAVVGILAVLLTLLIPAVKRSVEAGRRTQCVARQTRLALGMSVYDSRQNCLPGVRNALTMTGGPAGPPPGVCTPGWFIMLLPALERTDLYDQVVAGKINFFNANAGNNTLTTGNLGGLALNVTTCPSRGDWGTIYRPWSNMHYKANGAGIASSPFNRDDGAIGDNANGVVVSMADIAAGDGTSTTLMISEGSNETWYPQLVKSSTLTVPPAVNLGGYWYEPIIEVGGGQIFRFPSTPPSATTKVVGTNGSSGLFGHPGGVVVTFADGSSRFLKEDLKPHVYGHLMTQRSAWNPTGPANQKYSTNSVTANNYLLCPPGPGTSGPCTLRPVDY